MRGIRSDNMEGLGTAALCPEQVGVFTVCVLLLANMYPGCLSGRVAHSQGRECLAQRLLLHCPMCPRNRIKLHLHFTVQCVPEPEYSNLSQNQSKIPPSVSNVSQKQNKTFSFGMVIYNLEFGKRERISQLVYS